MTANNIGVVVLKTLFYDTVRDIIYFPIWWYSRGFYRVWLSFIEGVKTANMATGVSIWIKNIFVPMYGQTDFTGRIISVIIRLAQIIARMFVMIIWVIILFLKVLFWITIPFIIATQIFYQVTGGLF